jgi:hypothetical protein
MKHAILPPHKTARLESTQNGPMMLGRHSCNASLQPRSFFDKEAALLFWMGSVSCQDFHEGDLKRDFCPF